MCVCVCVCVCVYLGGAARGRASVHTQIDVAGMRITVDVTMHQSHFVEDIGEELAACNGVQVVVGDGSRIAHLKHMSSAYTLSVHLLEWCHRPSHRHRHITMAAASPT